MRGLNVALALAVWLAAAPASPAKAEILRSESALFGRTICWYSGWDSEQFNRDHSYVYSYHVLVWYAHQIVIRGVWAMNRDGTITLTMEGGGALVRKYDVRDDHVIELTGTLSGGADGYFC